MNSAKGRNLGKLAALVEEESRFAAEREVVDFIQDMASGLKALRLRRGLTQKDIADRLGISQGRVSQIESGLVDHAPNLETIARYARACEGRVEVRFAESGALAESSFEMDKLVHDFPSQFEIKSGDVVVHGDAAKRLSKALIRTGYCARKPEPR